MSILCIFANTKSVFDWGEENNYRNIARKTRKVMRLTIFKCMKNLYLIVIMTNSVSISER